MKKLVLAITLSLILTACGSGGGSSSSMEQPNFAEKEGTKVSAFFMSETLIEPHKHTHGINTLALIPNEGKFKGKEVTVSLIPEKVKSNSVFHYIDAKDIHNSVGNALQETESLIVSGRNYQNSRFGVFVDSEDNYFLTFTQGVVTSQNDLPKSANVTYRGNGLAMLRIEKQIVNNPEKDLYHLESGWVEGKSEFTVDFVNKKISGSLKDFKEGKNGLNIPTIIIGAKSFSNQSEYIINHMYEDKKMNKGELLKAQFYGNKAAELSGQYAKRLDEEKVIWAVFGAKKQ
ncbi:Transferrin binding protein-like solute binding protein [Phocoenobacter uteri]|uniref:Transferrin binding protein-like solute binding protein n=1 Tax=Phocoenobacter uteri TaxID=146806 RepID=A0A379C8G6_9PAST|nr:transferrin-binding protein-like solute binding protein [Phocoenobacter uteri]MDG6882302.1 hypothetical protein [Phocoenobacter uteri]SUB58459.1 Transferrin binding protein-like solute binding protein [Phocoenobacter uteri]